MKKRVSHTVKLMNPLNNEIWFCTDYSNVTVVDGVEFVRVFREEYPKRSHLIRKDALRKIIRA